MARTIGIDLGTTNSVIAFVEGERVDTAPNREGSKLTPSVVYYKSDEEILVGELAKRQAMLSPERVIRSIKRVMGKRFEELGDAAEDLPFRVTRLEDGMAGVELDGSAKMRPEEVSADILDALRNAAEDFLNDDVTGVVITVPAHFNDQQRTATKAAAEMAGLEVLRIINEPTAAALAYGLGKDTGGRVAVFDFGGGTFDISILQITGDIFEVLSTNGDNHLGGDDIDRILYQEVCDRILQAHGIDPTMDLRTVQRIREAAEKAKCELSSLLKTTITLPFIVADAAGPKHFEWEVTRDEFDEMMTPIFNRLFDPCRRALEDAHCGVGEIDEVILVGGSTRIPRVRKMVTEWFGREPNQTVNPDEAVAIGAAIQSGVLSGALREVLLIDVTPLTLGIELAGGVFKELIPRNSTIPCEASRKFTTVVDNQTSVLVHALQGERKKASENHSLARFRLVGIPPAPKELPEIEVRFSIDANGILSVSAMDLTTGLATGVVVENYGEFGHSRDIVEKLVSDASSHLAEDEQFMRFADKRREAQRLENRANTLIETLGTLVAVEHIRLMKESMLRLDIALEAMDERAVATQMETLGEIVTEYENNPDLAKALRRPATQIENLTDFDEVEFAEGMEQLDEQVNRRYSAPGTEPYPRPEAPAPKEATKSGTKSGTKPDPKSETKSGTGVPTPPKKESGTGWGFKVPKFRIPEDEETRPDPPKPRE